MRQRLVIATLVSAAVLLGAAPAEATTCSAFIPGEVVFEGIALGEPSPVMRFRVGRYLDGSGPDVVKVDTGYLGARGRARGAIAGAVTPEPGEAWRVVANEPPGGVLETSACLGHRSGSPTATPPGCGRRRAASQPGIAMRARVVR